MPNGLLARYFHAHGVFGDLDFASMKETRPWDRRIIVRPWVGVGYKKRGCQMMSDAEELRFKTFLSATSAEARDWIAYLEFEEAIRKASQSAAMVNIDDAGPEGGRERNALEVAFTGMFFNVLPSVDLAARGRRGSS